MSTADLDLHRAAILLASLPADDAARILARLDAREIEAVTIEIARTEPITADEQESVIRAFAEADPRAAVVGNLGPELARSLVEKSWSKAHRSLQGGRRSSPIPPFAFLHNIDSPSLLAALVDEHPQTVALVLSHLPAAQGAAITAGLAPDVRPAVIRRVAALGPTRPEIVEEVERGLERRVSCVVRRGGETVGGIGAAAAILHEADRETRDTILAEITRRDARLAATLRRSMFSFDDLRYASDMEMRALSERIEPSQCALALTGAAEALKARFFDNLPPRSADVLRQEMERLGPVDFAAVEQAQRRIVEVFLVQQNAGKAGNAAVNTASPSR